MIQFSNATPVQFWLKGQESFNTKIEPGVDKKCFFQTFNLSDPIKTQFVDDDDLLRYSLIVKNKAGNTLAEILVARLDVGVYEVELNPENEGLDEGFVQLFIYDTDDVSDPEAYLAYSDFISLKESHSKTKLFQYSNIENFAGLYYKTTYPDLVNGSFIATLDPSTSEGVGNAWAWTGAFSGSAINNLPASLAPTQRLRMPLPIKSGLNYKFELTVRNNDGGGGAGNFTDLKLYLTDGIDFSNVVVEPNLPLGVSIFEVELVATKNWPYVEITLEANNVAGQLREIVIHLVDLLEPVGNRPASNFAYRVKAKFFKERDPEENESVPQSDGSIVKLLGTVKNQKKLQVEPSPFYNHRKIKLILQHQSVYTDNYAWVKEENYETEDYDEHDPFYKGETFLTQKNNSFVLNPFS